MVAEPEIIESVEPDSLPRRGGRILSQSPAAIRARALRARRKDGPSPDAKPARGRTARKPQRSRMPRTPRTLYPEIAALLSLINTGVALTPFGTKHEPTGNVIPFSLGPGLPTIPMPELRVVKIGDELDEIEIAQLAKALDAQCQRSPRFRRYVEMALGVGSGGGVLAIVGIIAARRAARHGIVDPSLDGKLGAMLQGDLSSLAAFVPSAETTDTVPDPISGETAPVPGSDGDVDSPFGFEP